jgi:hypothetical protein
MTFGIFWRILAFSWLATKMEILKNIFALVHYDCRVRIKIQVISEGYFGVINIPKNKNIWQISAVASKKGSNKKKALYSTKYFFLYNKVPSFFLFHHSLKVR